MKFISTRLSLEQRWNGSAIDKHVCLNIAPHLCKPEGENDRATILYTSCDGLHKETSLQSLFQADEPQHGICVRVVPSGVRQSHNGRSRELCFWIERPAQFIEH